MKKELFYLKIRQTEKEYLVSVCDQNLLGKTITSDDLELCVNERFFAGDLVTIEKCFEEIMKATSCNLIGKIIINEAIKNRIINEKSVMWLNCPKIGKVGHAMLIR